MEKEGGAHYSVSSGVLQDERLMHAHMALGDIVELNVGGTFFTTTVATLTSHEDFFFARMFSSPLGVQRDRKGRVFVDRSGPLFVYVLEYLRTGQFHGMPADLRVAVEEEMRFYAIPVEKPDTVVSDSRLAALVYCASKRNEDLKNPVLQHPDLSEHMAELVLSDLHDLAKRGVLRTGWGNIVFVCPSLPPRLFNDRYRHLLPVTMNDSKGLAAEVEKAAEMLLSKDVDVHRHLPPEVKRFFIPPPEVTERTSSPSKSPARFGPSTSTATPVPADFDLVFEVVRGVDSELFFAICEHLKKYLSEKKNVTLHLTRVYRENLLSANAFSAIRGPADLIPYLPFARFTWNYF